MAGLGKRFKTARKAAGLSLQKIGDQLGVTREAINQWELGGTPSLDNLAAAAQILHVSLDWLVYGRTPDSGDFASVDVLELRVSAGPGTFAAHESAKYQVMFRKDWLHSVTSAPLEKLFVLEADGTSMAPTINHGDHLLIDVTQTDARREGIYVIRWGEVLNVKRLTIDPSRRQVHVTSDNPSHPASKPVKPDEIAVLGRVIWIGRRV
jgi:phage repressor protein C with HTH and peptisase S24 domain